MRSPHYETTKHRFLTHSGIRSPAANNGIYGFRPTTHRLPVSGVFRELLGNEQIICVVGPLSTSLGGIKLFMKTLLDAQPWLQEPSLVPLPWRDATQHTPRGSKLKVGVMWDDGVVKPHPPIARALRETVAKLSAAPDAEIGDWTPYKHDYAWELVASLYFCDGGDDEKACVDASGEPWLPLSRFILHDNPHCRRRSVEETWELTAQRERYRAEYAKLWNETATGGDGGGPVDVILCPAGPGAAPPLNCARYWGYTSLWNLLDYPALVFPAGKVDRGLDKRDEGYVPRNEQDRYNHELCKFVFFPCYNCSKASAFCKHVHCTPFLPCSVSRTSRKETLVLLTLRLPRLKHSNSMPPFLSVKPALPSPYKSDLTPDQPRDTPERYASAPTSLQLVGRRFDDEKVIQAYEIMQRHL